MKKILLLLIIFPFCLSSQNSAEIKTTSAKNSFSKILSIKKLSDVNLESKIQNFTKSVSSSATDTTYFESFENFNAETLIPDSWNAEYNTESTRYWHASEAVSFLQTIAPTDGDYMMWINFDSDFLEQDAWLISPEIQPKDGDILEFDLYYAPIFMYYKYNEATEDFYFDFSSPTATMKIMVAEVGSNEWIELWDAHYFAEKYDEENIFDYLGDWDWYKVSLQQYVGKTIKLAFQYVGLNGDSMVLDRILIGNEKGSNGLEKYEYSKDFSIKRSGSLFEIQTPKEFRTVSIKNLQGINIGTYNLNEDGTSFIDASGFTDKIYIFNFNTNQKNVALKVLNR